MVRSELFTRKHSHVLRTVMILNTASQEEHRAIHPRYLVDKENLGADAASDEPRGKKRKKAEDFL